MGKRHSVVSSVTVGVWVDMQGQQGAGASTRGDSDQEGWVHTWVTVQSLRVLTAAPSEASWADAHVAAALGVLAQPPVLQGSNRKSG